MAEDWEKRRAERSEDIIKVANMIHSCLGTVAIMQQEEKYMRELVSNIEDTIKKYEINNQKVLKHISEMGQDISENSDKKIAHTLDGLSEMLDEYKKNHEYYIKVCEDWVNNTLKEE